MPLIIPKKFLPLPSPGEFFEGRHQQVYLLPGIVKRQACPYRSIGKPETLDERLAAVVAGPHHDVCRLIELLGHFVGMETIDGKGDDPDPVFWLLGGIDMDFWVPGKAGDEPVRK